MPDRAAPPLVPYLPDAPAPTALARAPEAHVFRERLVETFERHVRLDSPSARGAATVPSTPEQRAFAAVLAADLRGLGFERVAVDTWANVAGVLPGTAPGRPLLYSAHLDVVDAAPCTAAEEVVPLLTAVPTSTWSMLHPAPASSPCATPTRGAIWW